MRLYWPLLATLLAILIGEAVTTGLLPVSRGHLFGLLGTKTGPIWITLAFYGANYFAVDLFQSLKGYFVLKLSLRKRTERTEAIIDSLIPESTNVPQRIQEDIKLSYLCRITVWCEYFISALILMQLFLLNLSEPTLIFAALGYAGISVLIAIRFNPRLTKAEIWTQQNEANYRTALVNNITDISLLSYTNDACLMAAKLQTQYLLFTKLQLCLVAVLPYIVLIPHLIQGKIDIGTLIQHQASFALIVVNAAVLISLYQTLIRGTASEQRVKEVTKND